MHWYSIVTYAKMHCQCQVKLKCRGIHFIYRMHQNSFARELICVDCMHGYSVSCSDDDLRCFAVEAVGSFIRSTRHDVIVEPPSAAICPCIIWWRGRIRQQPAASALGPSSTTHWRCLGNDRLPASESHHLPRCRLLVTVHPFVRRYLIRLIFVGSVRFLLSLSRCCCSTSDAAILCIMQGTYGFFRVFIYLQLLWLCLHAFSAAVCLWFFAEVEVVCIGIVCSDHLHCFCCRVSVHFYAVVTCKCGMAWSQTASAVRPQPFVNCS